MSGSLASQKKVVVVHRGARDAYQVAGALSGAGMLDRLVTDLYWPRDRAWARGVEAVSPASVGALLGARHNPQLPSAEVTQTLGSGLTSFALDKTPRVPFAWRRSATRRTDSVLGRTAAELARKNNSLLLAYSYYAFEAFQHYGQPGLLFQLHPHPESMRRILSRELEAHPECAASLKKEWELSLDAGEFEKLTAEPRMAAHCLAASSFTRRTLIENGTAPDAITVIPYGIDGRRFVPLAKRAVPSANAPLRLLFVGTINQRKGIKYLLDALRLLRHRPIEVTVCGRVVDDLSLFQPFASQVQIRPSVSAAELLAAYQAADLFVFPSVAEGFGQVLLESLACGLPILSTTHTAAPDLVEEGREGFVVAPCRPDLIAERIEWAATHRLQLHEMRQAARLRAEQFTWQRFRTSVVDAVGSFQNRTEPVQEIVTAYV